MCVSVCVCVCLCICVYAAFVDQENGFGYRRRFCFELREITPNIICKSLTQIGFQISRWRTKWRKYNTITLTQPFINIETSFFNELCIMTAHISCISLIQIGLQIRTKWHRNNSTIQNSLEFKISAYALHDIRQVAALVDFSRN